jgi:hypothetical protein
MPAPPDFDLAGAHRFFSAHCFNGAWSILDQRERSPADEQRLLALGYASFWHWTQRPDCTDANLSVAHWLLSRVHVVLGDPRLGRHHAEWSLRVSERPGVGPFYRGYACEAVARAASLAGDGLAAAEALDRARALARQVTDPGERALLLQDLRTVEVRR